MPASEFVIVTTTLDSTEAAAGLADAIVQARLAACVQQDRITSTYRWQQAIETADEIRLTAKTRADLAEALIRVIQEHHSYDTPEIIVTPILTGHEPYLAWIREETK